MENLMSFFISDYEIDKIIEEDINPLDLTSHYPWYAEL
jgi:hypothetical protein